MLCRTSHLRRTPRRRPRAKYRVPNPQSTGAVLPTLTKLDDTAHLSPHEPADRKELYYKDRYAMKTADQLDYTRQEVLKQDRLCYSSRAQILQHRKPTYQESLVLPRGASSSAPDAEADALPLFMLREWSSSPVVRAHEILRALRIPAPLRMSAHWYEQHTFLVACDAASPEGELQYVRVRSAMELVILPTPPSSYDDVQAYAQLLVVDDQYMGFILRPMHLAFHCTEQSTVLPCSNRAAKKLAATGEPMPETSPVDALLRRLKASLPAELRQRLRSDVPLLPLLVESLDVEFPDVDDKSGQPLDRSVPIKGLVVASTAKSLQFHFRNSLAAHIGVQVPVERPLHYIERASLAALKIWYADETLNTPKSLHPSNMSKLRASLDAHPPGEDPELYQLGAPPRRTPLNVTAEDFYYSVSNLRIDYQRSTAESFFVAVSDVTLGPVAALLRNYRRIVPTSIFVRNFAGMSLEQLVPQPESVVFLRHEHLQQLWQSIAPHGVIPPYAHRMTTGRVAEVQSAREGLGALVEAYTANRYKNPSLESSEPEDEVSLAGMVRSRPTILSGNRFSRNMPSPGQISPPKGYNFDMDT